MGIMKIHKDPKKYSQVELNKIKNRAEEIWHRKCDAFNTALDDWLQAEKEIRAQSGIEHKSSAEYTADEIRMIKERAQAVRDEKIASLRTAFDDWIEAENELKDELQVSAHFDTLFDQWFKKVSSAVRALLKDESSPSEDVVNDLLARQYIELMTECLN
jgi:hypothetical protein